MPRGKLLTLGRGGHTVYYPSRREGSISYGPSRLQGYSHDADEAAKGELEPGAVVIDSRNAVDTPEGFHMVIQGPMVDVDLAPGKVDRCPEPSPIMAAALAGNSYGTLLAINEISRASGQPIGPLDSVDAETYAKMWREAGARVGRWNGTKVIWEKA